LQDLFQLDIAYIFSVHLAPLQIFVVKSFLHEKLNPRKNNNASHFPPDLYFPVRDLLSRTAGAGDRPEQEIGRRHAAFRRRHSALAFSGASGYTPTSARADRPHAMCGFGLRVVGNSSGGI